MTHVFQLSSSFVSDLNSTPIAGNGSNAKVLMPTDGEIARAAKKYSLEGFLRRHPFMLKIVLLSELETECRAFEDWEPRDSMYRVSTFLVREWWGDPAKLGDALCVLLLIWNGAFYRYGGFDEDLLEDCLREKKDMLNAFRNREISSFCEADEPEIQKLFILLSGALKRAKDGVESPVSAGKALHLLAPEFFPLWDQYIAPGYCCPYISEVASVAYIAFTRKIRTAAVHLSAELANASASLREWLGKKTLLKRIDEYNYMKFTVPAMRDKQARANRV